MTAEERRAVITAILAETGAVTLGQIRARLNVSASTARRDLDALEGRGLLHRAYGGAVPVAVSGTLHHDIRDQRASRLADIAFERLRSGDRIFLDASPASLFLARRIVERGIAAWILTNSAPIMQAVAAGGDPRLGLHAIGGRLHRERGCFVGAAAADQIRQHYLDRAFITVGPSGEVAGGDDAENAVRLAAMWQARETVLFTSDEPA